MAASWKVCALVALCCALFSSMAVADDIELSPDCQDELNILWSNYTNPVYTFPDCDADCLSDCKEILESAIYTTDIKSCPLQDDITRCFKYYAPQWESYIEECSLFTVDDSGMPAGSTGEAEGEGSDSSSSTNAEGEAEAEAAAPSSEAGEGEAEAEAEAAAPSSGEGEAEAEAEAPSVETLGAEGEAEAEAPAAEEEGEAEAEAEAAAPPPAKEEAEGEAEAEAPAPSSEAEEEEEGEGEGSRRRHLLAEAEAEAAASSGSGICFPSFKSTEEFNMYINGEYFTLAYDPPSDTAGIVMSVFFWVGLAAMGFYLRK